MKALTVDNAQNIRIALQPIREEINVMAFVNEYIPEADYEKYDLRRICGEHNRAHRGHMYSRSWTIDRERDAFLIQVWFHRESPFEGWAFYWKGEWIFFDIKVKCGGGKSDGSCWFLYQIYNFSIPETLRKIKNNVVEDLNHALSDYCGGGVYSSYKNGSATVEFIEE